MIKWTWVGWLADGQGPFVYVNTAAFAAAMRAYRDITWTGLGVVDDGTRYVIFREPDAPAGNPWRVSFVGTLQNEFAETPSAAMVQAELMEHERTGGK